MKNYPVKNEVILAAAGSGKTFRLSDRIIKLLVNGAKPEEIVALTFTRAAAAEFITKTFSKLALAANNEEEAKELSKRLKLSEPWSAKQYRNLLRETLISMNRLSFGTLDSFFSKLVSNNAAEVGLDGGELKNLSEVEQNSIRGKIISQMLAELQLSQLCRDIRHINEGKVSATPLKVLDEQIKELHDLLTLTPEAELWGQVEIIWGKLPLKLTIPLESEVKSAIKIIYAWIEANSTAHATFQKSLKAHSKTIAENKTWTSDFSDALKWFRKNLNGVLDATENISFETTFAESSKIILDPNTCKSIRILNRKGYGLGIQIKLNLTQSIYKLLTIYEEKYNHTVRQQGNLTFSDNVTLLLKSETKANIDYRLDCSIKHWLFDEFQDTSTRQWKVLRNNLDEVANNSSDEPRTSFFVGDLKQSLYGWRGGNPEILRAVNNNSTFNDKSEKGSEEDSIEYTTRRCSAPIVELVNAFLDKDQLIKFGQYFSIGAAQKWADSFRQHVSLAKDKEFGEAMWVRLKDELTITSDSESADTSRSNTEELEPIVKQAQWIGKHLRQTGLVENGNRLLKHGITCAVLVPGNKEAAKITETLRRMGIEAADEANAIIAMDNPFTAGLVALITNAVHPADKFNEGLAKMCPTADKYINSCGNLENARLRCATQFIQGGAEAVVQDFLKFADLKGEDNSHAFLRKRAQQVIALAVNFDQNGNRNLGAFSNYLQESTLRDTADPRAVQVLTIHRSKGLEYTAVYLPGMNTTKYAIAAERENDPLISNNLKTFSPNWILSRPNKVCSERDSDTLNQALETERANVAYENLCKIYVGMTRATKRLVIISNELRKSSREKLLTNEKFGKYDFACLLEAVLGQNNKSPVKYDLAGVNKAEIVWSSGSDEWIDRINPPIVEPAITLKRDTSKFIAVSRVQKNQPSKIAKVSKNKKQPKSDQAYGKEFGTLVHSLFQILEWDTKTFSADINKKTIGLPENSYLTQAVRIIEQCLKSADIIKLLEDNSQNKILWKEKQAVIMYEGKMIDAVFDRVHITPGKEATIIDYKTNFDFSDDELEIGYKEQMNLYRISVSELTGIPVDKIKCVLINVRGASSKDVKF